MMFQKKYVFLGAGGGLIKLIENFFDGCWWLEKNLTTLMTKTSLKINSRTAVKFYI